MSVIAVDAMGGDFAPRTAVEGAALAVREAAADVVLVGDGAQIEPLLPQLRVPAGRVHVHHTPEFVSMTDAATAVLRDKPHASVREACALLRRGQVQGVVSAGHTGATMVAAKHELGPAPGIDRPAIATCLPQRHGTAILLDSGANVDCRPQYLAQFARMGTVYAQRVLNIGKFMVPRKVGQRTDAAMQHHALLLEYGAEVFAKPELEIYADDVECAHGNTCGALDGDQLFYLRQRGIPETEAKALLTQAFVTEALESAPDLAAEILRAAAEAWLLGK
jgi:hypothetical protein